MSDTTAATSASLADSGTQVLWTPPQAKEWLRLTEYRMLLVLASAGQPTSLAALLGYADVSLSLRQREHQKGGNNGAEPSSPHRRIASVTFSQFRSARSCPGAPHAAASREGLPLPATYLPSGGCRPATPASARADRSARRAAP